MLLDDIRSYLIAQGVVQSGTSIPLPPWPCFEGYVTDDQDQTVALFETGGYPADTLGRENERVTFQVRVRAARLDYSTARAKWLAIFNALQDSIPAPGYAFVQAMHYGPMHFNDDKGRPNLTANFRVMKARS